MSASLWRRAVAVFVLGGLFLWNAPAMAFPALVEQLTHCETGPAAQPAATPPAHHHHGMHAGMMAMAMLPVPAQKMSASECFVEHICCSFNREPARKSTPYAANLEPTESAHSHETSLPTAKRGHVLITTSRHVRLVFDLKADLRI